MEIFIFTRRRLGWDVADVEYHKNLSSPRCEVSWDVCIMYTVASPDWAYGKAQTSLRLLHITMPNTNKY